MRPLSCGPHTLSAHIVEWRDGPQFCPYVCRNSKTVYEGQHGVLVELGICAAEILERLIGLRVAFAPQYGLYALGHHHPLLLKLLTDAVFVHQQFVAAAQGALEGDEGVAQWHPYVA